jgi:hypothetical protein
MDETAELLTDGGSSAEMEEPDQESEQAETTEEETEQQSGEEASEEETEQQSGEEASESGDQRKEDLTADAVANDDEGTEVLQLDLRGLNLNLLGLDVSLSELVLDVSAVEGDGNLIGNLLSKVAGLLDGAAGSLLDGLGMEFDLGEKFSNAWESVKQTLGDAVDEVPIGEVLSQVVVGVLSQLLGLDDLLDDEDEGDRSEESDAEEPDGEEDDGSGNEESEE